MSTAMTGQRTRWNESYRFWADRYLRLLPRGVKFNGETMRQYISGKIGEPAHPNSWGSMASQVLGQWMNKGAVKRSGWSRMKSPKSRGRVTPTYQKPKKGLSSLIDKIFG